MLKKIKIVFNRLFKYFRWRHDSSLIRMDIKKNKQELFLKDLKPNRILVLAPHSDDEWIGCFSLIMNCSCIVCSMNMDGGDTDSFKDYRFNEMIDLSKLYNYQLVRLVKDKTKDLSDILLKEKPDYVAVPFFMDWHNEHLETMSILRKALGSYKCTILMYQVSCPVPTNLVNYVVPVSRKNHIYKWKTFKKIYSSQKNIPWKRFGLLERAQGGFLNSYSSNVFCIKTSDEWINMFGLIPSLAERERIKNNLNNLYSNYKYLNNLWTKKLH